MIIKQLFDQDTWTFTYLLADPVTKEAVIIDPVIEQTERDLLLLSELGLTLKYTLETHIHADHITASGALRAATGALAGAAAAAGSKAYDLDLEPGQRIVFGTCELEVRATPGHTDGCLTFVAQNEGKTYAFTGDALFIRGCGRTDFQQGSAATLYRSVHEQIFSLPGDAVIYPGHDYRGHSASTVAEEMAYNPRLNRTVTPAEFVEIMDGLNLAAPKRVREAVPANMSCGLSTPVVKNLAPRRTLDLSKYRLIDVREPSEFEGELGHIAGAELVPLSAVASSAEDWNTRDPLLVVCRGGLRAERACNTLVGMGFEDVTNLSGGMLAWSEAQGSAAGGAR
jgi:sulfur dioxygenase